MAEDSPASAVGEGQPAEGQGPDVGATGLLHADFTHSNALLPRPVLKPGRTLALAEGQFSNLQTSESLQSGGNFIHQREAEDTRITHLSGCATTFLLWSHPLLFPWMQLQLGSTPHPYTLCTHSCYLIAVHVLSKLWAEGHSLQTRALKRTCYTRSFCPKGGPQENNVNEGIGTTIGASQSSALESTYHSTNAKVPIHETGQNWKEVTW